jgi:hypothetical protein
VSTVLELFGVRTAASFLAGIIADAQALGLIVTSWRVGDPTRSTFTALARALGTKENALAELAKSAFVTDCSGDWLTILAREVYGIERVEATYATSTISVTNTGGGVYPIAARSWIFKNTVSGKTYRNLVALPTLSGGMSATIDVEAVEPGSSSNALANEIDALVTTKLGVVITASTAAVGLDQQDDEPLREQCRASRGALSPNGPADAYEYVARNPALTGVLDITRATSDADNANLAVTVYIAGTAGPVAGASVIAAQAALEQWATPLCVTPTVINSSAHTINVTADAASVNGLPAGFNATITAALLDLIKALPIGKTGGYDIDPTTLTTTIRNAVPQITGLPVYAPATPIHISVGQAPVLGTVVITEL